MHFFGEAGSRGDWALVVIAAWSLLSGCGVSSDASPDDLAPEVPISDVTVDGLEPVDESPPAWAPDPPGWWVTVDLHVHATGASNDAGPESTPARIAEVARERGLFAVVLQDHSNSTGSDPTTLEEDPALYNQGPEFVYWDEAAALSEEGEFYLVSGNEISPVDTGSASRGHAGCIPRRLDAFDTDSPFIDRPRGEVSGGDAVRQARERGCFTIVNHPYAAASWITYDWNSMDYDAIEVWNGVFSSFDLQSRDAWRCDRLQGRRVTPIAASDNHRIGDPPPGRPLDPALGWPSTSVHVAERTWEGVIAGLDAGRVSMHKGESRLFVDLYDASGHQTEGDDARWARVRGTLDERSPRSATLRLTRAETCHDPRPEPMRPPTIGEVELGQWTLEPGASIDVAVPVQGESGLYSATLIPRAPTPLGGAPYAALSSGILIP